MTQSRYHLMRHVQRHFTFEVDDAAFVALAQWAEQANAVCFLADGSVRDPQGRVLISQGEPAIDDDAQVPSPPNALQRRAQQLALLTAQGIRVPPSLSSVPGEAEVRVRDAAVVIQRMLALFAVALRAEMLAAGDTPPSLDEVDAHLPSGARPRRRHRSVVGARAVADAVPACASIQPACVATGPSRAIGCWHCGSDWRYRKHHSVPRCWSSDRAAAGSAKANAPTLQNGAALPPQLPDDVADRSGAGRVQPRL